MARRITRRVFLALGGGDSRGATSIEYGLIAALIGLALVGALSLIGDRQAQTFRKIRMELKKSVPKGGGGGGRGGP
ncbi:MAG: Flp family type IVb pilin [Geminicoccaceae bacterium]